MSATKTGKKRSPRQRSAPPAPPASPTSRRIPSAKASASLPSPKFDGHCAVVGLQFGDEGKGQIVDMLTGQFDFVARYNGGANAGHSVHIGDQKFALHLIPSGILYPDKINVVGNGVVVDPVKILEEIDGLRQRGVAVGDNLRISERAHVVFPYHKLQDSLLERAIAMSSGDAGKIGTTGRGIGPCYADKALRSTAVRMGELLKPKHLRERLAHIVRVKNAMLAALAGLCGEKFTPVDPAALADEYVALGKRLAPHICDTTTLLHNALAAKRPVLFEGANAVLLDVDHGTYPFVTSSNCSTSGVFSGTGAPRGTLSEVVGIVKLYTSRVGGGPFPTEIFDMAADRIREVGREFGTTTGRPRRIGWLDLVATRYTAAIAGASAIGCTGLSVLVGLPKITACIGYQYEGKLLDAFPADADVLADVKPVFKEFEGIEHSVDGCRTYAELPGAAKKYLDFVEDFIRVPVKMVCVGRRRDQILYR